MDDEIEAFDRLRDELRCKLRNNEITLDGAAARLEECGVGKIPGSTWRVNRWAPRRLAETLLSEALAEPEKENVMTDPSPR